VLEVGWEDGGETGTKGEEALGGGLTGSNNGEADGTGRRGGRGGEDGGEDGVDGLDEGGGVEDAVGRKKVGGGSELGRHLRSTSGRDDEVASVAVDDLVRCALSRRDPQDANVALRQLVFRQRLDGNDLFAVVDLPSLRRHLLLDLLSTPLQVVCELSSRGSEGTERNEGDKSRGGEAGEVGEEGVGRLGVTEGCQILEEAVNIVESLAWVFCLNFGAGRKGRKEKKKKEGRKRGKRTRFASCCPRSSFPDAT